MSVRRVPEAETAFGVYLHWPFCAAKCPYCDFNSHVRHAPPDQARYARAFARELQHFAALTPGRTVTSIFLGGGTPSLMEPATVGALLDGVARHWSIAAGAEITMEANPSSVEAERFRGYRAAGVNRVSLGVQALNDTDLRMLGRLHDVAQARRAIDLARATFPRLSFDLIYARPDQTPEAWEAELRQAIDLAADHLSLYQLTIEPETMFERLVAAGRLTPMASEAAAELYQVTQAVTRDAGLPAYEISNHARPGAESRHNLVYWRYRDYVGAGPGAHGRLTLANRRIGTSTERLPEDWLAAVEARGHGIVAEETLSAEEEADEMLLMGLRLAEGVDLERYLRLRGRPIDARRLRRLSQAGLIDEAEPGRLRASPGGRLVLDSVLAEIAA